MIMSRTRIALVHILPFSAKFVDTNKAELPLPLLHFLITQNTSKPAEKTATKIITVIQVRYLFPANENEQN